MGETALDEQIFEEYLTEMREHYTADKVCIRSNLRADSSLILASSTIYWVIIIRAHQHRRVSNGRRTRRFQLQLFHE
jgi:hypothetical protein